MVKKEGKMHNYPSDITREQFGNIESILSSCRKKTSPRRIDRYSVFCAILYLLKTGCHWRMLPKEYPKWRTCHYYFSCWSEKKEGKESALEKVLKKIGYYTTYIVWEKSQHEYDYNRLSKR